MCKQNEFIMKPKVDFCFKELMASAVVRQGFIAAVLGIRPEEVLQTTLLPPHLKTEHKEDKLGILDVRAVLNGNIQIDIEIQIAQFKLWPERSLFYLSKMYVEQIHRGEGYSILGKCIHVGILDFLLFEKDEEYYSRFHLWEDKRPRLYSDKFEIHIVELPKLANHEYPETPLLKWARFIRAEKKEELEMAAKTDPYIQKAYEQLLYISADQEKQLEYDARQKAILDHNYLMQSNWDDGYAQGESNGKAEGRIEGISLGEEKKLIEQVCKKLKKGCTVPKIAEMLEEEEFVIQKIYDAALEFAPDYDVEKVLEKIGAGRMKMQETDLSE